MSKTKTESKSAEAPSPSKSQQTIATFASIMVITLSLLLTVAGIRDVIGYSFSGSSGNEDSDKGEVYGAATEIPKYTKAPVAPTVEIKDEGNGKATLYLIAVEPVKIAGMEFNLEIEDGLSILNVACQDRFVCIDSKITEDAAEISILRMPEDTDRNLKGNVPVAIVEYDPTTAGVLVMNGDNTEKSSIFETGIMENSLSEVRVEFEMDSN